MLDVLIHNQSFAKSKTLLNQDLKKKIRAVKLYTSSWDPAIATYTGYDGYYATVTTKNPIAITTQKSNDSNRIDGA